MKIFDCHVHFEKIENYSLNVIGKNFIFNRVEEYVRFKDAPDISEVDSISLIFDYKNHLEFVIKESKKPSVKALKIHSRLQKIESDNYEPLIDKLSLISDDLPIIIDAFYFGVPMIYQPNLEAITKMLARYPQKKFVIAHCGGYEVLKYFFHLRTFNNAYYDLSFSLEYLNDSSAYQDLVKLIKFTNKDRILFGSDYPFGNSQIQVDILEKILNSLEVNQEDKEKIFSQNATNLFA